MGASLSMNGDSVVHLGAVTLPPLMRRPIEDTRAVHGDDNHKAGRKRHGLLEFETSFASALPFLLAIVNASRDAYIYQFPEGRTWNFSGYVVGVQPKAPVDGLFDAMVSVRPDGTISFPALQDDLLLETGDELLLETGDALLLDE